MGLTRLKKLKLKGFRSFVDETVVEFPETGMVLVRGKNLDSNGSSGSGKSSLNLAIAYGLGICPFPATALQSWAGEEPMQVDLTLDTPSGEVVIRRGSRLLLTVRGEKISGNAKIVEEKLREVLGLTPELLEALTYRKQMGRGQFLGRTDSEKKEFLTTLLGLEKFEKAVEVSQENIRKLEPLAEAARQDVTRWQEEVESIRQQGLEEPQDDMEKHRADLEAAEDKVKAAEALLDQIKAQAKAEETKIQARTKEIADSYLPRLQELGLELKALDQQQIPEPDRTEENRLKGLLAQAQSYLQQVQDEDRLRQQEMMHQQGIVQKDLVWARKCQTLIPGQKEKGSRIMSQIFVLEQNKCPTCDREWVQAQEKLQALTQELQETATDLKNLTENAEKIPALETKLAGFWFTPHPDIARFQEVVGEIKSQLATESARITNEISGAKMALDARRGQIMLLQAEAQNQALQQARHHDGTARERLQPLYQSMEDTESLARALRSNYNALNGAQLQRVMAVQKARQEALANRRRLEQVEGYLGQAQAKSKDLEGKLAAEKDFVALIGREGFLGSIFDEVLWEISDATNKILASIPNTAHVTLNFRSESTTQKGTIKKSIVPVVSIGGHEAPLASGCSGGMVSAVELAVDLAVAAVVSRRTGAVPSWLILDESFEGLGVVEKEGCLEILQGFARDRLVLVVDHASEFKEMFSQFIDVQYQDGKSRVL